MGSQWYNPLTFLPAFVSMTGLQVRSAGNGSDSDVYSVTGSHGGHRDDKGIQKQSQPRQEDGTISATSTRTSSDEGGDDAFWVQQNFFVENWCMAWSKQGSLQTTPSTWRRIRTLATDKGCSDEESSSPKLLECRTVRTLSSFRANMNVSRETVLALQLLFEEVDTKHSGTLDKEELLLFLKESAERQNLFVDEIILEMAVNSLVESVGGESDATYITKDEFLKIFEQHPEMLAAFDDQMGQSKRRLPRADSERREEDSDEVWKHATVGWKNRRQYIAWIVVMVGIGLAIGIHASIKWARNEEAIQVFGQCIVVARTCAALLNYLAGLILLPIVAKHTVPFAFFYKYLRWFLPPIEASMDFHILVGIAFAILATTHVLAHICDFSLAVGADAEDLTALFGDQVADLPTSKGGRMKYFLSLRASWTGILMVICLGAAYWAIRGRRTNFNRFWYFHHLLLAMIVLLCLHGTQSLLQHYQTIYWVGIPMLLYMVPRLYREFQCVKSKVVLAQTHGDVVDLRVQKPKFWPRNLHRPGMYAYMNVPEISRFEWHPFTISSSPDQDFIGFHIKQSGDWTRKLVELFREEDEMVERSEEGLALTKRSIQIKIQGPLGAPSQDFKNHEVVVLIGAGMGVTVCWVVGCEGFECCRCSCLTLYVLFHGSP